MASGLWSLQGNAHLFCSWQGCDAPDCAANVSGSRKGANGYDVKGYRNLEDARNNNDSYYEFRMCAECVNLEANGV